MHSAKTLLKSITGWDPGQDRATVVVVGWDSNPCEPLVLQALANHPGCKKLYFVPLSGPAGKQNYRAMAHDIQDRDWPEANWFEWFQDFLEEREHAGELFAYDLTDALAQRGGPPLSAEQVKARLQEHFNQPVVPLSTNDIDIYIAGHGQHLLDAYAVRRGHAAMTIMNDPSLALQADSKVLLPFISEHIQDATGITVTPSCQNVDSVDKLHAFMDHQKFDQVVLKEPDRSCGHGIYRVFREADGRLMVECPDRDYDGDERVFPLTEEFFEQGQLLAMEWLDNSKGDIRAILLNGSCVGAYKRVHGTDSWLCNYAQGASIHPVDLKRDLSRADRQKLNAVAKQLQKLGINQTSVDLLANEQGERFISEINIGNTDDVVELSRHWDARNAVLGRLSYPDQVAADILHDWRELVREDYYLNSLDQRAVNG